MHRVRKWWRLALLILAFLIAAQVGASVLARTHGIHTYLIAHLERAFGRTVEVRHFNIILLPRLVMEAEQVSIGEDPAFGNEYFLRAERLTAGLRWSGLLRGHFEFGTLSLSRPSLVLVRNEEGAWNLERWLPPAKSTLGAGSRFYGPRQQQTAANRYRRSTSTTVESTSKSAMKNCRSRFWEFRAASSKFPRVGGVCNSRLNRGAAGWSYNRRVR